jgi:hypothetical protein
LKRLVSKVSRIAKRGEAGDADANLSSFDEAKMQKAMALLEAEGEKISEDDPKQAANLMRKLSEAAGLHMGSGMEEALNRLEHGEDPEKIEEEMGDLLAGEEPFLFSQKGKKGGRKDQPGVDDTLYEL